jgi:hypothetical protein
VSIPCVSFSPLKGRLGDIEPRSLQILAPNARSTRRSAIYQQGFVLRSWMCAGSWLLFGDPILVSLRLIVYS